MPTLPSWATGGTSRSMGFPTANTAQPITLAVGESGGSGTSTVTSPSSGRPQTLMVGETGGAGTSLMRPVDRGPAGVNWSLGGSWSNQTGSTPGARQPIAGSPNPTPEPSPGGGWGQPPAPSPSPPTYGGGPRPDSSGRLDSSGAWSPQQAAPGYTPGPTLYTPNPQYEKPDIRSGAYDLANPTAYGGSFARTPGSHQQGNFMPANPANYQPTSLPNTRMAPTSRVDYGQGEWANGAWQNQGGSTSPLSVASQPPAQQMAPAQAQAAAGQPEYSWGQQHAPSTGPGRPTGGLAPGAIDHGVGGGMVGASEGRYQTPDPYQWWTPAAPAAESVPSATVNTAVNAPPQWTKPQPTAAGPQPQANATGFQGVVGGGGGFGQNVGTNPGSVITTDPGSGLMQGWFPDVGGSGSNWGGADSGRAQTYLDMMNSMFNQMQGMGNNRNFSNIDGGGGSSSGSGTAAGVGGGIGSLLTNAYNQAYRANQAREGEVRGIYEGMINNLLPWLSGQIGGINQGYSDRTSDVMAMLEGYGDQTKKDIRDQGTQMGANVDQSMVKRGLYNTTVRDNMQRGVQDTTSNALARAGHEIAKLMSGTYAGLTGEGLGAAMNMMGMEFDANRALPNAYADFIERITNMYPDMAKYLNLGLQAGQGFGANQFPPVFMGMPGMVQYPTGGGGAGGGGPWTFTGPGSPVAGGGGPAGGGGAAGGGGGTGGGTGGGSMGGGGGATGGYYDGQYLPGWGQLGLNDKGEVGYYKDGVWNPLGENPQLPGGGLDQLEPPGGGAGKPAGEGKDDSSSAEMPEVDGELLAANPESAFMNLPSETKVALAKAYLEDLQIADGDLVEVTDDGDLLFPPGLDIDFADMMHWGEQAATYFTVGRG